jgi:hypothetical protein
VRRSMVKLVEAFIDSHVGHFEHLIQMYFSAITHNLNISGLMLIWTSFLFWYVQLVPKICLHLSVTLCIYLNYPFFVQCNGSNVCNYVCNKKPVAYMRTFMSQTI